MTSVEVAAGSRRTVWQRFGESIDRYVFPEGESPHLPPVLREMAAAGFEGSGTHVQRSV